MTRTITVNQEAVPEVELSVQVIFRNGTEPGWNYIPNGDNHVDTLKLKLNGGIQFDFLPPSAYPGDTLDIEEQLGMVETGTYSGTVEFFSDRAQEVLSHLTYTIYGDLEKTKVIGSGTMINYTPGNYPNGTFVMNFSNFDISGTSPYIVVDMWVDSQ